MAGDPPPQPTDYRGARIGAAAALTTVLVLLLIFDAISGDYDINQVVLVGLLGTVLTLLGIEAGVLIRRNGK